MAIDKLTSQSLASGAVTSDAIATGAITAADIPNGEITAAKLSTTAISDKLGYTPVSPTTLNSSLSTKANTSSLGALSSISPTGTADSTKFLRGDYSWQAPTLSSLSDLTISSPASGNIIGYVPTTTATGGTFSSSNWSSAEWGKSDTTVVVNSASTQLATQLALLTTGSTITITLSSNSSTRVLTLTGAPYVSYGTTYVIPVTVASDTGSTEGISSIVIPSGSITTYSWKNSMIGSSSLVDGAITAGKISDGAVTAAKLGSNAVFLTQFNARTSQHSLGGDSGWVDHLSMSFTTNRTCNCLFIYSSSSSYESGAVQGFARLMLDGVQVGYNSSVARQSASNHAGSGTCFWDKQNVSAGTHTITVQVRNTVGGTTWITPYWSADGNTANTIGVLYYGG